jgi:metal-responsive CopG/Arc/MetJ family transcriptional regulator
MGEDIFSEEKKVKIAISITLDSDLLKELENYKKEHEIKSLSPMLNKMLRNWINKEKEKTN